MDPINLVRVGSTDICAHSDWKPRAACAECDEEGWYFAAIVPKAEGQLQYRFPIVSQLENGHTYDPTGKPFCLNTYRDATITPPGWDEWLP